jgi:hypothetical protein
MNVSIEIPGLGATATSAQIIDNHTDVVNMHMIITVGLFSDAGDLLKTVNVDHQLTEFPIPSTDAQWAIVQPVIDQMQQTPQ